METDSRNLTAKVWGNLDSAIKTYDFKSFDKILCRPFGTVLNNVMSQQYNSPMGTRYIHYIFTKFHFS